MPIDWSILRTDGPVDIAGNFARGYQMSTAIIDKLHERNALAAVAANPDDQQAGFMEQRAIARRKATQDAQDRQRAVALGGLYTKDPQGAREEAISAGDFDLAKTFGELDETTQKRAASFWEKAGPIAYKLKQTTDPAARQALWQQARPILESEGIDSAQLDKFDPTNDAQLDAAITTSQKISDLIGQGKIEWHQQGENPSFATDAMGHPVGTQNPASAGTLPVVHDQAGYDAIPPGGHYVDPDGHMRVKGGQSGGSSAGGFR
jgi:hypothetical protein